MSRREDGIRLEHMLAHANEAVAMAAGREREHLDSDRMLELALTRLVEIVGEAANRVGPETRIALVEIPWARIVGMRHRLAHGYDKVDPAILWETVRNDFPILVRQLEIAIAGRTSPDDADERRH